MLRKSAAVLTLAGAAFALVSCHSPASETPPGSAAKPAPQPPPPEAPAPAPAPVAPPPAPVAPAAEASSAATTPDFIALPGGRFHFGCEPQDTECKDLEKPGADVSVKPFKLMRTEVTVAEYGACVSAGKCLAPKVSANPQDQCNWLQSDRMQNPINCVSWDQATAYCAFVGGRLPTAQEWEWAAKGGTSRIYPWGDEPPDLSRAQYQRANGTAPVGSFPTGATKQGLQDMAGNVWEWTASPSFDGAMIEVRGGSWRNGQTYLMRASHRGRRPKDAQDDFLGFRCAQ